MGAAGSRRRQAGQSHGMINLANAKMSVNSSVALKQNLLQGNQMQMPSIHGNKSGGQRGFADNKKGTASSISGPKKSSSRSVLAQN